MAFGLGLGSNVSLKGASSVVGGFTGSGLKSANTPAVPASTSYPYKIKSQNWIATVPYALYLKGDKDLADEIAVGTLDDEKTTENVMYFFPINPDSLSINTPFASLVTPTVGGIVEEHSGAVFHQINVSGTTGVAPGIDFNTGLPIIEDPSRPLADTTKIPGNLLGGFFSNVLDTANSLANTVLGSKMPTAQTELSLSGYAAFHSLYKLLYRYAEAKRNGSPVQLLFVNYKDGNQYQVLVKAFSLKRDKSRPHLYNYSIDMVGWNLGPSNDSSMFSESLYSDERLAQLGLKDGQSLKAELSNTIGGIKSTLRQSSGLMNAVAGDLRF